MAKPNAKAMKRKDFADDSFMLFFLLFVGVERILLFPICEQTKTS